MPVRREPVTSDRLWLHRPRPVPEPRARLVGFPYAGRSGTMFRSWAALMPDGVELCGVNLPGRESRFAEFLPSSLHELAGSIAAVLRPVLDTTPTAFFGHSLGGLLAFEVSRRLRSAGLYQPHHLVVSGCRPPHLPRAGAAVASMSDDQLIAELRRLNGTTEEILGNPAALELLLPVLRADFGLADDYVCPAGDPLPCPITALTGAGDPETDAAELARWSEQTTAAFVLRTFPGDHFFLESARPLVAAAALQTLLPHLTV
jgi:medium-chain acyl-[acyl-carrier-protein] hydrolase